MSVRCQKQCSYVFCTLNTGHVQTHALSCLPSLSSCTTVTVAFFFSEIGTYSIQPSVPEGILWRGQPRKCQARKTSTKFIKKTNWVSWSKTSRLCCCFWNTLCVMSHIMICNNDTYQLYLQLTWTTGNQNSAQIQNELSASLQQVKHLNLHPDLKSNVRQITALYRGYWNGFEAVICCLLIHSLGWIKNYSVGIRPSCLHTCWHPPCHQSYSSNSEETKYEKKRWITPEWQKWCCSRQSDMCGWP